MVETVTGTTTAAAAVSAEDLRLIGALRRGDERAFASLLDLYHASLIRLAMVYVGNRAVAEEVAQETWLGVVKGIDRFEGRSSLKTWIFRILTNTAKTRAEREGRTVPISSLTRELEADELAVEPDRFIDQNAERWGGHWAAPPTSWETIPETRLVSDETQGVIEQAIDALPAMQRQVITLRDVQGFPSEEVCELLTISEANQRVLLHRGRSKVRAALEVYFEACGDQL